MNPIAYRRAAPVLPLGALAALLALAACGRAPAPPAGGEAPQDAPAADPRFTAAGQQAAAGIGADYLRSVIAEVSDDRYGGRAPGTPGDEAARSWLAGELGRIGFAPGGEAGGWEQPFELVSMTSRLPPRWRFVRDGKAVDLAMPTQAVAVTGVQAPGAAVADAELAFVGYGIQAPEYGWDDYKGADLRGKVLLMLNNDPDWDPALFQGATRLYYGRWEYKFESAARQGAAGAIIVHTTPSAGYPWGVVQTGWTGEQFALPATDDAPHAQVEGWVTEEGARALAALAGRDLDALIAAARSRDFAPVPLGVTTSLELRTALARTRTANVLGVLEGRDPALKGEAVVLMAHHDHLGTGEPDATGDRIYNGAIDNGAGMAQVLAVARALAALPERPRRSILVAFVAAEESGLLGSGWYAEHPTFAPGRIAAAINYDEGNTLGRTRDLVFIGKGKSSLDGLVEAIAARQGRVVTGDPYPDRGYYYRSDQFSFAKIGVPALYIDDGVDFIGREPGWGRAQKERYESQVYHQPADEFAPDWNYEGMVEDAQAGFWTALLVADGDALPAWNPGDEFEAARQAALAALASP